MTYRNLRWRRFLDGVAAITSWLIIALFCLGAAVFVIATILKAVYQ